MEEDAEFKRKRHKREGRTSPRPIKPLYTVEDAENSLELFNPVKYKQTIKIGGSIEAAFYDAGHILGSSIIKVKVPIDGETTGGTR